MRSFALSAIAFLTLGVFSSAAPTPVPRDVVAVVAADVAADVKIRRDSSEDKCLDSILDGVVSAIDPILKEIREFFDSYILSPLSLTQSYLEHLEGEVTTKVITPLLEDVKEILSSAIEDVKEITGDSSDSILKSVGGLLDINGVAKLISKVLTVCTSHLSSLVQGYSIHRPDRPHSRQSRPRACFFRRKGRYPFTSV